MTAWQGLFKTLEMGDHVIAHTPGAKQPIYANRGADHAAYANFSAADHIAAANVHANRAKELHISAARQGGSLTLKRQAAQSMHIATTHRQAGVGKPQRLAASMAARKSDVMKAAQAYSEALIKSSGGAGSRGGNVVGRTSSGKPIYSSSHQANSKIAAIEPSSGGYDTGHSADLRLKATMRAHGNYSAQDHADAAKMHSQNSQKTGDLHDRLAAGHNYARGFLSHRPKGSSEGPKRG